MASSSNDSVIHTFSLPNVTHFIQPKLDSSSDYLNWTAQFIPLLKTHDLLGIVDGSSHAHQNFFL
jgi:hypothetical protein